MTVLPARRALAGALGAFLVALTAVACTSSHAAKPLTGGPVHGPPTATTLPAGAVRSSGCLVRVPPPGGRSTIAVGPRKRSYLLTAPAGADPTRPLPLVVLLHGFGGDGAQITALTRLPPQAAEAGMVALAPDGTARTWGAPDVPFVEALLAHVERTRCIDRHRVFLTGFSAGAAFAISYACNHPHQIAAIATVAVDFQLGCTRPTSILAFHGTADPMVPYGAGLIGLSVPGYKVPGTPADLALWAKLGRCDATPARTAVGSEVQRQTWSGCAPGIGVELYRIAGGGHSWPGADPRRALGLTTRQVDATKVTLAFFAAHHLPS